VYPAHGAWVSLGRGGELDLVMEVPANGKMMEGNARSWLQSGEKSILEKLAQSHRCKAQRF
jgi:hypothetical protein